MRSVLMLAMVVAIGAAAGFVLQRGPGDPEVALPGRDAAPSAVKAAEHDPEGEGLLAGLWRGPDPAGGAREEPAGSVYYQWVDDAGSVHFVRSRDEVPEAWRERAGRVELAAAPRRTDPAREARSAATGTARRRAFAVAAAPEVVVYTTSWCGWCRKTLAFLDRHGVDYVNKDIESDERWREELIRKTGRTSIPVVEIDGKLIRGFDPGRMQELLRSS